MPVFKGNTTGSIMSQEFDIPAKIRYYTLTNVSGGSITVSMFIIADGSAVHQLPYGLTLDDGDMVVCDDEILLLEAFTINIITSGSLDYYFTLE